MCDTMVALSNSTIDGSVLFAKNSDRYPNEAHYLSIMPSMLHDKDSMVKCTYIEIPQVSKTYAVLLAKPYWIWGAEMGANEKGVVIGNEAVFSKEPYGKEPGLIGMDFLRLALERADTAQKAMFTIIELLERYGQSGVCCLSDPKYYHNSFLITDRKEAWVLETSGKHWVAEKVKDVRSISNIYTIHEHWDLASDDLIEFAVQRGWSNASSQFDFGKCYTDMIYTTFSNSRRRHQCTSEYLNRYIGNLDVGKMMRILRSHGLDRDESDEKDWSPDRSILGQDVCAHSGFGPVRVSQTTGSMISVLSTSIDTHWATATSAPCTGIFKPIWIDAGLPDLGAKPGRVYDNSSIWWQHELLHRQVIRNYHLCLKSYKEERDLLEEEFIQAAENTTNLHERYDLATSCFNKTRNASIQWLDRVRGVKGNITRIYYQFAWEQLNRDAKIPL